MKKFFIPCEEANHVCDKNQYKEASILEMVKLNLHLMYCRACRKYSLNNGKLTKLFNSSSNYKLDSNAKMKLQKSIVDHLKNKQ